MSARLELIVFVPYLCRAKHNDPVRSSQFYQNYAPLRWVLFLPIFLLLMVESWAQNTNQTFRLDPIEQRLSLIIEETNTSKKFSALLELAQQYAWRMNPFTVQYLEEKLSALPSNDPLVPAAGNFLIGEFLNVNLQKFEKALFFYEKARQKVPGEAEELQLRIWERIATVALHTSELERAIPAADSCVVQARRQQQWFDLAHCLKCKGDIRRDYFQDPPTQIQAYREALVNYQYSFQKNIAQQDTLAALLNLFFIAAIYLDVDTTHTRAGAYIDTAAMLITPAKKYDDFRAQNWYLRGKVLFQQKNYSIALDTFSIALNQFAANKDTARLMQTRLLIGDILYRQSDYLGAIEQLSIALQLHPKVGSIDHLQAINFLLYQSYKQSNEPWKALAAQEAYVTAKDQATREDQVRLLTAMEAERGLQEKQEEIKNQQNELESKNLVNLYLRLVTLVLLALLGTLLYNFLRARNTRNELRNRNHTISQQKQQLEELDNLKSRFFTNISHELRTPLTLIMAPLQHLQNRFELSEDVSYYLNTAKKSTRRLQQLVNELLDFSKIEAGKTITKLIPADIHLLTREIIDGFLPLAQEQNIKLLYATHQTAPVVAWVDIGAFEKILTNLISNALKFSPAGSEVEVALSIQENNAVLSVKDQGPGIHPDDLPHLFERFHQSRHQDRDSGTGIGLALSAELAELLNGNLKVESQWGNGSQFLLELPLGKLADLPHEKSSRSQDGIPAGAAAERLWKQNTTPDKSPDYILIVENHDALRDYMARSLKAHFKVFTAANGKEALELIATPDSPFLIPGKGLIISDLMMPVMDGLALLDHLKSDDRYSALPVIMLTARRDRPLRLKALTIGVDDYLIKPFDNEELLIRIDKLLKGYRERVKQPNIQGENTPDEGTPKGIGQNHTSLDAEQIKWLKELEMHAVKNLSKSQFSVSFLSSFANMSDRNFQRHIKKLTGLTPSGYIKEIRLHHARGLLESGNVHTVKAASKAVGFNSPEYFSDIFQNRFGKKPSSYLGS